MKYNQKDSIEIKNMKKFFPMWHPDGALTWKLRTSKKKTCLIAIEKIIIRKNYKVNKRILAESREQYQETHKLIPVYLTRDLQLKCGYEQYLIAQEIGLTKIPFQFLPEMKQR